MIAFFANIFGYLLNFIYNFIGNYGWSIILFSIIVKIVMLPISIKQQKTMKKSQKIQEKMKQIQIKYKGNPEMLNQATMELYKTEKMSPFSGCLSAIVQLILLFSVFYMVRSPLTYMRKIDSSIIEKYSKIMTQNNLGENNAYPEIQLIRERENILKLKEIENVEETENKQNNDEQPKDENAEEKEDKIDLAEINGEELENFNVNMEFFGLNLAQVPTKSSDWKAYIIPFLYVVISIISMKITNPTNSKKKKEEEVVVETTGKELIKKEEEEFNPMEQMNKNMNMMFPIMYLAVALVAPLGLALYWLMNSLLMIIERLSLNKLLKDKEGEEE